MIAHSTDYLSAWTPFTSAHSLLALASVLPLTQGLAFERNTSITLGSGSIQSLSADVDGCYVVNRMH